MTIKIRCKDAPCAGMASLSGSRTVTVRKGKKTSHRRETVRYGAERYSVAAGKTVSVTVVLNGAGRSALDTAKGGRLTVTETATVTNGTSVDRRFVLERVELKSSASKGKH